MWHWSSLGPSPPKTHSRSHPLLIKSLWLPKPPRVPNPSHPHEPPPSLSWRPRRMRGPSPPCWPHPPSLAPPPSPAPPPRQPRLPRRPRPRPSVATTRHAELSPSSTSSWRRASAAATFVCCALRGCCRRPSTACPTGSCSRSESRASRRCSDPRRRPRSSSGATAASGRSPSACYRTFLEGAWACVSRVVLVPSAPRRTPLTADCCPSARRSPWHSPGNPDPTGVKLRLLREALSIHTHIQAVFFDYASLFQVGHRSLSDPHSRTAASRGVSCAMQHPPNGQRTSAQDDAFKRALELMGDVYASAVGTTVLQARAQAMPDQLLPRPHAWRAAMCARA